MSKSKDILVYTVVTKGYDDLVSPKFISDNCDHVCFTDETGLRSDVWDIRAIPQRIMGEDDTRKNRYMKILPHLFFPEYKYSLYVDGDIDILCDVEILVRKYLHGAKMAIPRHPSRDCIYQESEACIRLEKDTPEKIQEQMSRYRELGFPEGLGLPENRIILREHNDPEVVRSMEDWWREVSTCSRRDQLSFGFVCWKNDFKFVHMEDPFNEQTGYFRRRGHRGKGLKRIWQVMDLKKDDNAFFAVTHRTVTWVLSLLKSGKRTKMKERGRH